jgi:hypothetical protein
MDLGRFVAHGHAPDVVCCQGDGQDQRAEGERLVHRTTGLGGFAIGPAWVVFSGASE